MNPYFIILDHKEDIIHKFYEIWELEDFFHTYTETTKTLIENNALLIIESTYVDLVRKFAKDTRYYLKKIYGIE